MRRPEAEADRLREDVQVPEGGQQRVHHHGRVRVKVGGLEEAVELGAAGAEVGGEQRQDEVRQQGGHHERGDRLPQGAVLKVQEGEGVVQGEIETS